MQNLSKPIYPVLPSTLVAAEEVKSFVSKGHVYFPDEVLLGEALAKVYNTKMPSNHDETPVHIDKNHVKDSN